MGVKFSQELFSKVCKRRQLISILMILIGVSIFSPFFNLITKIIPEEFLGFFVRVLSPIGLFLIVLGIISLVRNNKKSLLTGYRIGRLGFQGGILEYHKDIIIRRDYLPDYIEDRIYEIDLKNIKSYHKSFWQTWIIRR